MAERVGFEFPCPICSGERFKLKREPSQIVTAKCSGCGATQTCRFWYFQSGGVPEKLYEKVEGKEEGPIPRR